MRLSVVDLEMNQNEQGAALIQIGAVLMDMKTGQVIKAFDEFINPNEVLEPRIIELTGIQQADVDNARPLKEVLTDFWGWLGSKNLAAWGRDCQLLIEESKRLDVPVPERLNLIDLKETGTLLRCAYPSGKSRGGLKATMGLFEIPFVGRHHNALFDAFNTAILARHWVARVSAFNKLQEAMVVPQLQAQELVSLTNKGS